MSALNRPAPPATGGVPSLDAGDGRARGLVDHAVNDLGSQAADGETLLASDVMATTTHKRLWAVIHLSAAASKVEGDDLLIHHAAIRIVTRRPYRAVQLYLGWSDERRQARDHHLAHLAVRSGGHLYEVLSFVRLDPERVR